LSDLKKNILHPSKMLADIEDAVKKIKAMATDCKVKSEDELFSTEENLEMDPIACVKGLDTAGTNLYNDIKDKKSAWTITKDAAKAAVAIAECASVKFSDLKASCLVDFNKFKADLSDMKKNLLHPTTLLADAKDAIAQIKAMAKDCASKDSMEWL